MKNKTRRLMSFLMSLLLFVLLVIPAQGEEQPGPDFTDPGLETDVSDDVNNTVTGETGGENDDSNNGETDDEGQTGGGEPGGSGSSGEGEETQETQETQNPGDSPLPEEEETEEETDETEESKESEDTEEIEDTEEETEIGPDVEITNSNTAVMDFSPLAAGDPIVLVRADGEPLEEGGVLPFDTVLQLPEDYAELLGILDSDGQPIVDPDILDVQIQWQRVYMGVFVDNSPMVILLDAVEGEPGQYLTVRQDIGQRTRIRAQLTVSSHDVDVFTELVTVRKQNYAGTWAGPVTFGSVSASSISIASVSGAEYRLAQIGDVAYDDTSTRGRWQSSRTFSDLAPATAHVFAVRMSETNTHLASPTVLSEPVSTLKRTQAAPTRQPTAAANGITKDSLMLTAISAVTRNGVRVEPEYAISETRNISGQIGDWQNSVIFTGLEEGNSYYFFSRYQETDIHQPSPPGPVSAAIRTLRAYVGPGAGEVTFSRITGDRIEIKSVTNGRYRIAQIGDEVFGPDTATGAWKSSRNFTGLRANTAYTFEIRIAATSTTEPSPVSTGTARTLKGSSQRAPTTPNVASGMMNGATNQRMVGASWVQLRPSQRPSDTRHYDPAAVIEYGISHQSNPPAHAVAWQTFAEGEDIAFYGLSPNTRYYFFSRMSETEDYEASPRSASRSVLTTQEGFFSSDGNQLNIKGDFLPDGTSYVRAELTADISQAVTASGQPLAEKGRVGYAWRSLPDKDGQPDMTARPQSKTGSGPGRFVPTNSDVGRWIYVEVRVTGLTDMLSSVPVKIEKAPMSMLEDLVESKIKTAKSSVTLPNIAGVTYTYSRPVNGYATNFPVPQNRVIKNLQPQENIRINISSLASSGYETGTTGQVFVKARGVSQPQAIRPVVISTGTQSITIQTQPGHSYGLSTTSKIAAAHITQTPSTVNPDGSGTLTFSHAVERSSGRAVELRPNTKYHVFSIRDSFEADGSRHEPSKVSAARAVQTAKAMISRSAQNGAIIRDGNRLRVPGDFALREVDLGGGISETWTQAQLGKLTYRWHRVLSPDQYPATAKRIGTKATYALKKADMGMYIRLEVTAAKTGGSVVYIYQCGEVNKALKVPKKPEFRSSSDTSISIYGLTPQKGHRMEYACVPGSDVPDMETAAWQSERTFSGLAPRLRYSIYARQISADGRQVSRVGKPLLVTTQRSALAGELGIRSNDTPVPLGDTASYVLGNSWSMDTAALTHTASGGSGGFAFSWHRVMTDGSVRKTGFGREYTLTAADMADNVREIVATVEAFDCVGVARRRFINPEAAGGGSSGWFSGEIVGFGE